MAKKRLYTRPPVGALSMYPELMAVNFAILWFDFWIGLYYDQKNHTLYFCPLPCFVFEFIFWPGWPEYWNEIDKGLKDG